MASTGCSYYSYYHDGQIVWGKQCDRVNIGEVGIFIYDGEGYIKMYDEQEPDEEQREAFSDSYGTMYMQPVMISYNQKSNTFCFLLIYKMLAVGTIHSAIGT